MKSPLSNHYKEEENQTLVRQSLAGDSQALERLIHMHQPFIYNVAWKMAHDPNDAMDLTQETLLKVITKLSQYSFKSSFRTWLYRIVVNEFLQSKRRKQEERFKSLEDYGQKLDAIPNPDLTVVEKIELKEVSREMQIRCMSGMLMCLNREQRLIYILGDTFGIDHNLGAEIFDISPQNFRVKLHRARKDLQTFMDLKCGLVNKANPCRCPKKAKALVARGVLSEEDMQFNISYKSKIADYAANAYQGLQGTIEGKITSLYREHPTREEFDKQTVISEILDDEKLMRYLDGNR